MKKHSSFTKALSVFLSVLMLLSVGTVGLAPLAQYANAYVTVTPNEGSPVFSLNFNVPESIYLKPGSGAFQYFLTNTLTAAGATAVGNAATSCDVTVVAPMADSMTLTYELEANGKKPDGSTVSASGLSLNVANNVTGAQALTNVLTGKALSGYTDAIAGNEYFIKWTLKYKVTTNGTQSEYTVYAYTSIYVPSLQTAGSSIFFKAAPTIGFKPRNSVYNFLTGGHTVSGGNGYASRFTSSNVAGLEANKTIHKDNLASATFVSPLVAFTGGNSYNGSKTDDIDYVPDYPFAGGGSVPAGNRMFDRYTVVSQANGGVYAKSESIGNGQWFQVESMSASEAPKLNITIDASRFSNYSQVPNLSAGWMQYGAYGIEAGNRLRWIAGVNTGSSYNGSTAKGMLTGNDAKEDTIQANKVAVSCAADTTDERNNYISLARGLSELSGNVTTGHNVMMYAYKTVYDGVGSSTSTNAVIAGADLNVTATNKINLRNAVYEAFLKGYAYKSGSDSDVEAYVNAILAADKVLADQFASQSAIDTAYATVMSTTANDTTKEKIDAYYKEGIAYDYVSFNVPETVYLNVAKNSSGKYDYQYVMDQSMTINSVNITVGGETHTMHAASLTINGKKTFANSDKGNIEFYYADVDTTKPVTLSCSNGMGATYTALTRGSDGKYTAYLTGGSVSTYASGYITWYVNYTDKVDGYQKSAVGKTYVYATPNGIGSTLATQTFQLVTASKSKNRELLNWAIWLTGVDRIAGEAVGNSNYTKCVGCSYAYPPLTVSAINPKDGSSTDPSNSDTIDGCYVENSTSTNPAYSGYQGWWWKHGGSDSGIEKTSENNWKAYVYFDKDRFNNTNQLPYFRVGLDVFEDWGGNNEGTNTYGLGFYKKGGTENRTNVQATISSSNGRKTGQRVVDTTVSVDLSSMTSATTYVLTSRGTSRNNGYEVDTVLKEYVEFTPVNKSDLRSSILNAQKKFSEYGIYYNGTSFDSIYYNKDNDDFNAFINAYDAAVTAAAKCDGSLSSEATTLASAITTLDDAITNNSSDSSNRPIKKPGTAKQVNVAYDASGDKKMRTIKSVTSAETTFTENYSVKDAVSFTAESYAGYDFLGFVKSSTDFTEGNSLSTMTGSPSYVTASNYMQQSVNISAFGVPSAVPTPNTVPAIATGNIVYNNTVDTAIYMVGLYQPHKYNVVYHANGGDGTDVSVQGIVYGDDYTISSATVSEGNTFEKQYYLFNGWNTASDGTGKNYTRETVLPLEDMPTGNGDEIHLYAQWTLDLDAFGSLTVDAAGGTLKADLFTLRSMTGNDFTNSTQISGFTTSETGRIHADISDAGSGINIKGTYTTNNSSSEATCVIPVVAQLNAGTQYTLSYKAKLDPNLGHYADFYFFKEGESGTRANIHTEYGSWSAVDAEGYRTFTANFTAGDARGDANWNLGNATGWYKLRLDIDGCKTTENKTYEFEVTDLKLVETNGTAEYTHTTYGLPDSAVDIPIPTKTGFAFDGWSVTTGDAARLEMDGNANYAYNLTDKPAVVTALWRGIYNTVGYDNMFSVTDWYTSLSPYMDADDVHVFTNTYFKTVEIKKDTENSSQSFSNDSFGDNYYKIPVSGNTEYSFSYNVSATKESGEAFTTNAARIRIRMWDADGNELFIDDMPNNGAPYGTSAGDPIVYQCFYPELNNSPVDNIIREWAFNPETGNSGGDANAHLQIYTGAASDDGYTELYFVTPANCAYVTVGFGALAGAFKDTIFTDLQMHKTAVYDERVSNDFSYEDKHGIVYPSAYDTAEYGKDVSSLKKPTRLGYDFNGWSYTEGADSGSITSISALNTTKQLWSTWVPKKYAITFNRNHTESTGTETSVISNVGYADKFAAESAFTRTGYEFLFWNTASNGSGTTYAASQTNIPVSKFVNTDNSVNSLFAQWAEEKAAVYDFGSNMTGSYMYTAVKPSSNSVSTTSSSNILSALGVQANNQTLGYLSSSSVYSKNGNAWQKLTAVPASNVMFEETALKVDGTSWSNTATGTVSPIAQESFSSKSVQGYDDFFKNSANGTHSNGNALLATPNATTKLSSNATFTFTGTGFDLISACNSTTGIITAKVTNATTKKSVKTYMIDTYYSEGDLTQVPILHLDGLDRGSYTVQINAMFMPSCGAAKANASAGLTEEQKAENVKLDILAELDEMGYEIDDPDELELLWCDENSVLNGGAGNTASANAASNRGAGAASNGAGLTSVDCYIDGVRIYKPLTASDENKYYDDSERGATYVNLINNISNSELLENKVAYVEYKVSEDSDSFTDMHDEKHAAKVITQETYQQNGPQNEVYLTHVEIAEKKYGIAFNVYDFNAASSRVMVSFRAVNGTAKPKVNAQGLPVGTKTGDIWSGEIASATEMYYDITELIKKDVNGGSVTIVIENEGSGMLAVNNVKLVNCKFGTAPAQSPARLRSMMMAPMKLAAVQPESGEDISTDVTTPDEPVVPGTDEPVVSPDHPRWYQESYQPSYHYEAPQMIIVYWTSPDAIPEEDEPEDIELPDEPEIPDTPVDPGTEVPTDEPEVFDGEEEKTEKNFFEKIIDFFKTLFAKIKKFFTGI